MGARPPPGAACVHCGATETPLWRTGPAGPKTLCNACGVRWKKTGSVIARGRRAGKPAKTILKPQAKRTEQLQQQHQRQFSLVASNNNLQQDSSTLTRSGGPQKTSNIRTSLNPTHGEHDHSTHGRKQSSSSHSSRTPPNANNVNHEASRKSRPYHKTQSSAHRHSSSQTRNGQTSSAFASTAAAAAAVTATSTPNTAPNASTAGVRFAAPIPHAPLPRAQYDSIFSGLMVVRSRAPASMRSPQLIIPSPSPPPANASPGPNAVYVTELHAPSPSPSPPPIPRYSSKGFSLLLAAAAETKERS